MAINMLLSNSWAGEIAKLFTTPNYIICLVCLAIGITLCAIECFIPGFGVCGITGILFCVFSIVYLLFSDGTLPQFLFMLGISIIIIAIVLLIAVRSARFGLLSKSPLVQKDTALPQDFSENEKNYQFLVGKVGKTETTCKPIGKAVIDGISYSVITNGEYLPKDTNIVVAEVDGTSIIIKQKEENSI
jgi:membrane-bound serine protease (ClpP class)